MAARLEIPLFPYRAHCFFCANQDDKSREVCIKARSPPVSLSFMGQVTEHGPVKMANCLLISNGFETCMLSLFILVDWLGLVFLGDFIFREIEF